MKRFLLGFSIFFLFFPFLSFAQEEGWVIDRFESDIGIQVDGSVEVSETIAVDFGSLEKHGIYRDLPYVYSSGSGDSVYTRVSDIQVLQDGSPAQTEITKNNANIRIRIGNPNVAISEEHEYVISYTVLGVLQSFDGFDELNWNVTGNDWGVPIGKAEATISSPASILQASCYEGALRSTEECDEIEVGDSEVIASSADLDFQEGLTVAVGFESGVIPIVSVTRPPNFADAVFSVGSLVAFVVAAIAGSWFVLMRWWKYGRDRYWQRAHLPGEHSKRDGLDQKEKIVPLFYAKSVSVEYDPPDNLRPAEIGVLMDERADTLDVSATIVDLAARGYLEITEIEKKWIFGSIDYEFVRTDKSSADLLVYEQELLDRLFEDGKNVKLSDLKNSFYKDLRVVKDKLYEEVITKKLFPEHPNTTRVKSIGLAFLPDVLGVAGIVLAVFLIGSVSELALYHKLLAGGSTGLFVVGVLALIVSPFMPRKTAYGRELYERSKGYELFVSGTEKYRAKFYEDKGLFVEVLPYAIMFGVTDQLARAFKEMEIEPPQPVWFHGAGAFNATAFASSVNTFSKSLSSAMASSPSSSGSGGGGFSGGGSGGGGGGSW